MNGLDERLTNDLTGLADAAEFRPEGAAAIANAVRRRRQTRRLRHVALVAAVVVAIAGFAAREVVSDEVRTEDDTTRSTVTIAPSTTTAPPQTTETTAATTTSTTAAPPVVQEFFLTGDGLGSVRFGDGFDSVLAALEAEFGPARLSGPLTVPEGLPPGCESGLVERSAVWNGLMVIFRGSDADSLVFRAWSAGPESDLTTPEGLRVSDTPQAWKEAYGNRITFEPAQPPAEFVTLDLHGEIAGYAYEDAMSSMAGGVFCAEGDF